MFEILRSLEANVTQMRGMPTSTPANEVQEVFDDSHTICGGSLSDPEWCNVTINLLDAQGPTTTNDDEDSNDYSDEELDEDDEEQKNYSNKEELASFVPDSLPPVSAMPTQVTTFSIVL